MSYHGKKRIVGGKRVKWSISSVGRVLADADCAAKEIPVNAKQNSERVPARWPTTRWKYLPNYLQTKSNTRPR